VLPKLELSMVSLRLGMPIECLLIIDFTSSCGCVRVIDKCLMTALWFVCPFADICTQRGRSRFVPSRACAQRSTKR
jgi:hypothetical protein